MFLFGPVNPSFQSVSLNLVLNKQNPGFPKALFFALIKFLIQKMEVLHQSKYWIPGKPLIAKISERRSSWNRILLVECCWCCFYCCCCCWWCCCWWCCCWWYFQKGWGSLVVACSAQWSLCVWLLLKHHNFCATYRTKKALVCVCLPISQVSSVGKIKWRIVYISTQAFIVAINVNGAAGSLQNCLVSSAVPALGLALS